MRKSDFSAPTQKFGDSPGLDRNLLADHYQAAKNEFNAEIQRIFFHTAQIAFGNQQQSLMDLKKQATDALQEFFNTMKGGVNLSPDDITAGVDAELDRQRRVNQKLAVIAKQFQLAKIQYKILPPDELHNQNYWDTQPSAECEIEIQSRHYLFAFPLGPATAPHYLMPRQDPIPGTILHVDTDIVIGSPYYEEFNESFWNLVKFICGECKSLAVDFPKALKAEQRSGFLFLDLDRTPDGNELEEWKIKYNVSAILHGNLTEDKISLYAGSQYPSRLHTFLNTGY